MLSRSFPGFGGESGRAEGPEPSGEVARVLGLVPEEAVVPARPRATRGAALPLDRIINGSLVNSQVMPLVVHFWHGCCKLHFTLAFAHASQDLRRDRLL